MNDPRGAVIDVRDLEKSYRDKTVVRGVTFSVRRGEVYGLLGPNGAGKTTTLETIVGLRRPTSGTIRVLGLDPAKERRHITERMAVQPQTATLFPTLTVQETVDLFASFYARSSDPSDIIEQIGLADARRVRVKHLSGGQRQRLLVGIALVGQPEVLVLDEPSAGLDPSARRELWNIIERQRECGTTVLLSTHLMGEAAEVCDQLAILIRGRIAAEGEPAALIREHSTKATVSFTVPPDKRLDDLEALGLAGVITVAEDGSRSRVRVATADPDAVIRRLTFALELGASDYSVKHGSLEDLFIELSNTASDADGS